MRTEPNYNVFSILAPKTRKQQNNEGNMIHTHHLSREEKTYTTRGDSVPHFLDKDMYRLNKYAQSPAFHVHIGGKSFPDIVLNIFFLFSNVYHKTIVHKEQE